MSIFFSRLQSPFITPAILAVNIYIKGPFVEEGLAIFSLPRMENQNQQVEAIGRQITASKQETPCKQQSALEVVHAACLSH